MLPGALFSTYKQYKDDTKTIIEWLADAARRCGYDPTAVAQDTIVKKAPKLKGRARKLARDAAAATTKENAGSTSASTKTLVVKVREFVPMAKCVAESKATKVVIPLRIIKTFKNCIDARNDTHKWYEAAAVEDQDESNLTHAFFIDGLKQALQVLVPVAKLQELDKNKFSLPTIHQPATESPQDMLNRFTHLEIQDVDEKAYEAMADANTVSSSQAKAPLPKAKYVPEEVDTFSEWLFALNCFMDDVATLQEQLKGYWEEYADGEIDLTTAAVATNTAIEMVKKAEEELNKLKRPDLNEVYKSGSLPDIWFMECCLRDGIPATDASDREDRDMKFFVPMKCWDQVKESYLLLYRLAIIYSNGTTPGKWGAERIFAITRPAYLGTYNPELEWDEISPERQYEQIAALLNDMFVTIGGFTVHGDQTPNDDMLMEGIAYLQRNQVEPPMWLLFACQNFLDVHFALKTKSERPYEELRDYALSARRTIKAHQKFLRDHPMPRMRSAEDEEALQDTLDEIEQWTLEDEIKKILNSIPMMGKTKKRRVWQDFEILRMSPVLCGMWKYCFHIQLQWKGITLVNDTGLVTAAHLYNALQQNGYLKNDNKKLVWDDMEYLLDLHRAEDTFMGTRPKSIEDCTKRLALVQGVAPQTFARRRRGNNHRVLRSRAGSKFLKPSTPVAQVFGQKYLSQQAQPLEQTWHLEQVNAIVGLKFEKDRKDIQDFNKQMNTRVDALDLTTEEGKSEIYVAFFEKHKTFAAQLAQGGGISKGLIGIILAQRALDSAAFDCAWAKPVQKMVDEDKARIRELEKEKYEEYGMDIGEGEDSKADDQHLPEPTSGKASISETAAQFKQPDDELSSDETDSMASFTMRNDEPRSAWLTLEEIIERWERTKSLPLDMFIDVLRDSLELEYLDIQFDYFAFFRSVFSLLLKLQESLLPLLRPRLLENIEGPAHKVIDKPEGAVCVIPQLSVLVACDPLKAPNLLVIRPWLEVDLRPLELMASIMKPWIEDHGDEYILSEDEREERRLEGVTKAAPPVQYIDDDDGVEPHPSEENGKSRERKVGYSSAVGLVDGLNAREMREIYDKMKEEGITSGTVAQTMQKLRGLELDEDDLDLVKMNQEILTLRDDRNKAWDEMKQRHQMIEDEDGEWKGCTCGAENEEECSEKQNERALDVYVEAARRRGGRATVEDDDDVD